MERFTEPCIQTTPVLVDELLEGGIVLAQQWPRPPVHDTLEPRPYLSGNICRMQKHVVDDVVIDAPLRKVMQ